MWGAAGLVLAVLLGFGFGFSLERGGFGSSRRLAAQFYFHDMTVFKVMFTAIITAMVGLFGPRRLGLVDLAYVWINPTFSGRRSSAGSCSAPGSSSPDTARAPRSWRSPPGSWTPPSR